MTYQKLLPAVKKGLFLQILRAHKARKVSVFGSFARGNAHPSSDVDLLIDFDKDADLFDQAALRDALKKFFKREVDILTPEGLNRRISKNILKEAVPIA